MSMKKELLSIGKISHYTGASVYSLRYYERIGLLEPAFIDPHTEYRYYSFEQIYLIEMILICVELDIPLKELTRFIDTSETIDYSSLLTYGKKIGEKKLKTLEKGLKLIKDIEQHMALVDKHSGQEFYLRDIPEKFFYAIPCEKSIDDTDPFEIDKAFLDSGYFETNGEMLEYGFFCEYSPQEIKRYAFIEIPEEKVKNDSWIIPGGTYCCTQNKASAIEKAPLIFSKYLKGNNSFLAIETEVFASKYEIGRPINELRIIA